jgi:hypothetical protein
VIPEHLNFGGGVGGSVFSPVAFIITLLAGILILGLPRAKAIVPYLAGAILIPTDQILVLGSLHFPMHRILLLFGLIRVVWTKLAGNEEVLVGGMNAVDWAVLALASFISIDGMFLWQESQAVIYQFGTFYTGFGAYLLLRFLIRDEDDVLRAIRTLACIVVVLAGFMTYEVLTTRNLIYAALGGARSAFMETAGARDDRVRAAGSFAHPILAGTFGGIMLPLFVSLWIKRKNARVYAMLGTIGAAAMAVTANSSTALFGLLGGIVALCFWPLRRMMRLFRWGVVATLLALHAYMTMPVWHLISDVDLAGGSSSYHRYMLVDQCIKHFWVWALVGTKDYASWGWDMWDLSNQYVWTADTAGLIPFIAFLSVIIFGFKYLGRARRVEQDRGDKRQELFIWAIGAALFANCVGFFGITYWDQTQVGWYALLAIISTVTRSQWDPITSNSEQFAPGRTIKATPTRMGKKIIPQLVSRLAQDLRSLAK